MAYDVEEYKSPRVVWWRPPVPGEYHKALFEIIDSLRADPWHYEWYRECLGAYLGTDVGMLSPEDYDVTTRDSDLPSPFNAAKSAVDTIFSMLESEPRPVFLTDGAEPEKQRLAADRTDAVYAVFSETKFYDKWREAWADGGKCGLGLLQITHQLGKDQSTAKLIVERVFPYELLFEKRDAYNGAPRTWIRLRLWDEHMAIARWCSTGDKNKNDRNRHIIESTPTAISMYDTGASTKQSKITRQIIVAEAFHLPSGEGCDDGVHAVCTSEGTLDSEPWEEESPPFIACVWEKPEIGFWGRGMIFDALGMQRSLDEIELANEHTFGTQSKPFIAIHETEDEVGQTLSAQGVPYVKWKNMKPERIVDPITHPQALDRARQRKAEVFEQLGVSQLDAAGLKPAGLNSGRALRNLRAITSQRLSIKFKNIDESVVDAAKRIMEYARRLEKSGIKVVSRFIDQKGGAAVVKKIEWSKLVAEDIYDVIIDIASSTAKTLAGKNNDLEDLFAAGLIPPDLFLSQYQSPDLKDMLRRINAPRDLIRKQLAKLLEERSLSAPGVLPSEAQPRLELALEEATHEYALAALRGEEDEVLELISQWEAHVARILQRKQEGLNQMMIAQATAQMAQQVAASPPGPPSPGALPPLAA